MAQSSSNRRLMKELEELRGAEVEGLGDVKLVDDSNLKEWNVVVLPAKEPYNKGAFRFRLIFPEAYPFQPPKVEFQTKVYHPNVADDGKVCVDILSSDDWRPSTRALQIITRLIQLLNHPEPQHPVPGKEAVAELYRKDLKKFNKEAEAFTKKFAESRKVK